MEPNTRDDEGDAEDAGGRRRRRLAVCSALVGLAGGWLLWTSPATPTISLPSPSALKPNSVNTLFLLSILENIKSAKPLVNEERERSAAERDAFARFSERVSHIDAARSPPTSGGSGEGGVLALDAGVDDTRLDAVTEAYRETVLAVAHYDEEYGEPAVEHMAEEFGQEIAATLERGQRFTPQIRDILVEAATESTNQRDALVRTLDQETESLSRAERVLNAVESELDAMGDGPLHYFSFDELTDAWLRLSSLEHRCEELLRERQKRIQHGHAVGRRTLDGMQLHRYLYQSIDTDHPILSDGAAVVDRVRSAQHRMTQAISRRV